jgi:uncharacterized protein YkwD
VLRHAIVCLVNAERRRVGVRGVRSNARLRRTALAHADDMVRRRYFRHDSLDGRTFLDRIVARRYAPRSTGFVAGEALAWGTGRYGTPQAVVRAWMASPSHRRVLLLPAFRDIGVGVRRGSPLRSGAPAASYVANFGVWGTRRLR